MGAKAMFLGCGLFIYAFAPMGFLPSVPGQPHTLLAAAGLVVVGPLIYNTYR